jgi:hypothetical protein
MNDDHESDDQLKGPNIDPKDDVVTLKKEIIALTHRIKTLEGFVCDLSKKISKTP